MTDDDVIDDLAHTASDLHDHVRAYLSQRGFTNVEVGSTIANESVLITVEIPQSGSRLELTAGGPTADSALAELMRVLVNVYPSPTEH